MASILIAECIHEICSFNPVPTRYDDLSIQRGNALFDYHRPLGSEVGGALKVFDADPSVTVVPTLGARGITSGGTIAGADFERLPANCSTPSARPGRSMVPTSPCTAPWPLPRKRIPRATLQEARKILGEKIPIVASFDLHGILTDRMLQHADAIVVYHTYPHVDFFETGQRSARLLLRLLRKEIRPVTARVAIPALVRGDELITASGVFGQIVGPGTAHRAERGGLSAGMFIGNPFTDVPELCCDSVVVTDGDAERAQRDALRLATEFWEHRHKMQARLTSLEESVRIARDTQGTVILMDPADATSSGASGDSNAILRELMRWQLSRPGLAADRRCRRRPERGPGGHRRRDPYEGRRHARCETLSAPGDRGHGTHALRWTIPQRIVRPTWFAGTTAVLQADNVTLVVTSRPVHLYDRSLFLAHGLDPRQFNDRNVVRLSEEAAQHRRDAAAHRAGE